MILLVLIIFLINIMFLTKDSVLNKLITYSEINCLKDFILASSDAFKFNMSKYCAGNELTVRGNGIKHQSIKSHTIHYKLDLSQFINHQQSSKCPTIAA